jgi:hypothetical protein
MSILKYSIENPGTPEVVHSGIFIGGIIFSMALSCVHAKSLLAFFKT